MFWVTIKYKYQVLVWIWIPSSLGLHPDLYRISTLKNHSKFQFDIFWCTQSVLISRLGIALLEIAGSRIADLVFFWGDPNPDPYLEKGGLMQIHFFSLHKYEVSRVGYGWSFFPSRFESGCGSTPPGCATLAGISRTIWCLEASGWTCFQYRCFHCQNNKMAGIPSIGRSQSTVLIFIMSKLVYGDFPFKGV